MLHKGNIMNKPWMPVGYESMKREKKYWKMKDLDEENKFRIMITPITGWIEWEEYVDDAGQIKKNPIRHTPDFKPSSKDLKEGKIKEFWACYIWDYKREDLFVVEFHQSSIIKALKSYGCDEDWGDFREYDFKLCKEGDGKMTRYSLTALPKKPIPRMALETLETTPISLEALYEGLDPWDDCDFVKSPVSGQILDSKESKNLEALRKKLKNQGHDVSLFEEVLDIMLPDEAKQNLTAEACLSNEETFERFIKFYKKTLDQLSDDEKTG